MRDRSIRRLAARYAELKLQRISWEQDWRSIQANQLPQRGRLDGDGRIGMTRGERRGATLMDETAEEAADKASAGIFAGLTSPSQPWHREALADKDQPMDAAGRLWLGRNAEVKRTIWRESGVYNALRSMFLECPGFGTAIGVLYPDFDSVIRVMPLTVGEYWAAVDHRDEVTELIYRREMTGDQILSEFFDDDESHPMIPRAVREAMAQAKGQQRSAQAFTVLCYIGPNKHGVGGPGQKGKPWISEYWLEGATGEVCKKSGHEDGRLKRWGFSYKPILAARWERMPGDAYGRGCGHKARAAAAQLQHQARTSWRTLDYLVNPPLQGPAWTTDRETDMRPGAYNPLDAGSERKIESLWNVPVDRAALKEEIAEQRARVRSLYYNDILAAFMTRGSYAITAMEAGEISQEKLTLFAPIVIGFISDLLIPLNEGTQAVMEMSGMYEAPQGLVGPPPDSIAGAPLEFEFIGPLAQAMKLVMTGQIDRMLGMVTANAAIFPELRDEISPKRLAETYADHLGVDARILKTEEEKAAEAKLRAAEAKRQQMAEQAALAAQSAGAAKTLSETELGAGGSALDALGSALLEQDERGGLDDLAGALGGGVGEDLAA